MNIILSTGIGDKDWLEHALKDVAIDLCVCISRYEDCLPNLLAKEYIWYEGHGLDSVDWKRIRPLDESVVESMRDCECIYLNFLSRTEAKRDVLYEERKREYLQCLRYWNHMFEEKGIDLFVTNEIPHFGFDYIPYMLCKQRGVPSLFFTNMRLIPDVLFLLEDWENPTPALAGTYARLKKEQKGDVALPKAYEDYIISQTEKKVDPTPWHMRGKKAFTSAKRPSLFFSSRVAPLKHPPSLKDLLLFIPRRLKLSYWKSHLVQRMRDCRRRELFRFYDAHTVTPDLTKRYVYLALHMQPECSTAPMAGAYVDQLLMVQMLQSLLPDNVLLYVKEHPDQGKRSFDIGCRSIAFYEDLLACSKVRLVPRTFSTFDLTEHAKAIATATGSAGFEALFRGKPVFMFGHRFYQDAPAVFPIHSTDDCRKAVKAIFEEGVRPTLSELRLFLKAIEEIAIPAAVNTVDAGASQFSWEEQVKVIGGALRKRIEERLGGKIVRGVAKREKERARVWKMQMPK